MKFERHLCPMLASAMPFFSDNAKAEACVNELDSENEHELLNSLETILSSTKRDLHEFIDLEDIPQIFAANNLALGIHDNRANVDKTDALFDNFSTLSVDASKDNAKRTIALESKCEELRDRIELLTKEKETASEEIKRLKDQILNQSAYCASLGAVLGNLTWRASRFPQIVDIWLSAFQDKIGELLSIVNGSFGAFVNTYGAALPPTGNVEYQFMIGLLGIVTNVSASPEGREFLITNSHGAEFVRKIIEIAPELPSTPGSSSLKRLMLMILYNASMNKTGLRYLLELQVDDMLRHYLDDKSSTEEMQLLCLRVLQSITYDLAEPKYIRHLTVAISIDRIETMASSKRTDISDAAKQVVRHLRDCQQKIAK